MFNYAYLLSNLLVAVKSQQSPQVFHNSSAIARSDLYVLTLTLP
ncbi:hypothetical protein [Nostoc sp.]